MHDTRVKMKDGIGSSTSRSSIGTATAPSRSTSAPRTTSVRTSWSSTGRTADHHSFLSGLLAPSGVVLDVGARGFIFAREMVRRGMRVVAMEPDPAGWPVDVERSMGGGALFELSASALVGVGQPKQQQLARWDNGEANRLITETTPRPGRADVDEIVVQCINVTEVSNVYDVREWDLVKMNCEGSEFEILRTWPGPIAKQISVSFHDHTGANPGGEATYQEIFRHLEPWYEVVQHVWEERYCAGPSYWDSVLVMRDFMLEGIERKVRVR